MPRLLVPRIRGDDDWVRRFRYASLLRRKNPVPLRVQADQVAGAEFAVARTVDLDQRGPAAGRQRHLGALGWPQRAPPFHRALQEAAADRADLHVVAADEQF